ncbi:hypothetical protein OUZ56_016324 [Daphnia magna]|uniref:Uncharacterized protein n=1 Tax=Daphnia magna TaxID=35525 RepID=A0ABR0AQB3_9CRUS|nr:hypothetical protein OUZ56_016324 [Daphnia magna]
MKVPIPKYTPKPPPIKPAKLTEAWKKHARYDNGNGTLPGSLTWYEFCKFIKELENGIDGNGSSIIDVVRLRWILNMSHGFRKSSTERAAVQKFVRRSATIWGVPDSSTPIGRFEPSEEPILEDETLSSETAQLAIDLLRSEAAADDQMSHLNYKENQYLQATEAALEKIHGGIECGYLVPQLNLIEAQRVIHAFPEIEPDIAEILKNFSSNFQENEDIDDLTLQVSPYSTFLPSDVRIMAEHPLDIYVLNG